MVRQESIYSALRFQIIGGSQRLILNGQMLGPLLAYIPSRCKLRGPKISVLLWGVLRDPISGLYILLSPHNKALNTVVSLPVANPVQ